MADQLFQLFVNQVSRVMYRLLQQLVTRSPLPWEMLDLTPTSLESNSDKAEVLEIREDQALTRVKHQESQLSQPSMKSAPKVVHQRLQQWRILESPRPDTLDLSLTRLGYADILLGIKVF